MTIPQALVKLSKSRFRGRFKLNGEMKAIFSEEGYDAIRAFAEQRVAEFLAPAAPTNDGHQTPMKGHPVFLAQHATATCCRTCLNHWWRVQKGVAMTQEQQNKAVNLIMAWIEMHMTGGINVLVAKMSPEELASIPFWKNTGERFQCPYRTGNGLTETEPHLETSVCQ